GRIAVADVARMRAARNRASQSCPSGSASNASWADQTAAAVAGSRDSTSSSRKARRSRPLNRKPSGLSQSECPAQNLINFLFDLFCLGPLPQARGPSEFRKDLDRRFRAEPVRGRIEPFHGGDIRLSFSIERLPIRTYIVGYFTQRPMTHC